MKFSLSFLYSGDNWRSFSCMNQVLRIWDTHLQVCLQRLSGMFPKGPSEGKDLHFSYWNWNLKVVCNLQGKLNGSLPSKYIALLDEVCHWALESCVTFMRQKWPPHNQYISIQFVVFLHVYSDLINLQLDSSFHYIIATK